MLIKERELFVEGKEKNTFQLDFLIAKSILYGEIQWKNLAHSTFRGDATELKILLDESEYLKQPPFLLHTTCLSLYFNYTLKSKDPVLHQKT